MNAIVWVLRTGAPWCELPEKYGPWHTAYNNFRNRTREGVMGEIFKKFSPLAEETMEFQIDSTYVKARQHSTSAKKGALMENLSDVQAED